MNSGAFMSNVSAACAPDVQLDGLQLFLCER